MQAKTFRKGGLLLIIGGLAYLVEGEIRRVIAGFLLLAVVAWVGADIARFHGIVGKHKDSWFGTWLEMPYTNARVLIAPHKEYETTNAIKSEVWRVREAFIGGTAFWTALERKPVA